MVNGGKVNSTIQPSIVCAVFPTEWLEHAMGMSIHHPKEWQKELQNGQNTKT
jgi:hypothetical protein